VVAQVVALVALAADSSKGGVANRNGVDVSKRNSSRRKWRLIRRRMLQFLKAKF
tara:strand:- start:567 stop:728 length:162 start_codon:yes stop_codon:yes gene_type:complete